MSIEIKEYVGHSPKQKDKANVVKSDKNKNKDKKDKDTKSNK